MGGTSKEKMESREGLHLGLKESKNTFRDQAESKVEATKSVRGKTRE